MGGSSWASTDPPDGPPVRHLQVDQPHLFHAGAGGLQIGGEGGKVGGPGGATWAFAVVSSYTSQVSCPPRTQEVSPISDTVAATESDKSRAQLEAKVASCFSSRGFKGSYIRSVGGWCYFLLSS